ncbi:hypothetical protein EDC96DRAFT_570206 [Choanephora cucurbitarum]|nr:hypothetical protein EDC96DRAFT_570206 [Choanephora cucurbitarum]
MVDTDSAPDPSKGRNRNSMHIVIELSVDGFKALAGSDPTQTFAPMVIRSLGSLVRNRFENARQTTKTAALSAHRCLEYKVNEAKRKQLSRLNKFFRSVDEQDLINEGSSRDERTYKVVEERLSATLRDALPVWALKF